MRWHLSYRRYRLPLLRLVRTARGEWSVREGLLVRLETAGGSVGFGEVAPVPGHGGGTLEDAEAALERLGADLTAASLEAVDERLGCLRFALAAASAGAEPEAPANARLPVAALLPAGRAALPAAARARQAGYAVCKWKVGVEPAADERAMLDEVLGRLGPGAALRLDANGAWSAKEAGRWLDRCAGRPVEFVEQPCFADPAEGTGQQKRVEDTLFGLARDFPTPLALDESVTGLPELRAWLERGWTGVVVVKPALAGPPAEVLALLATHGADAVFSSALETVVGRRAALRTAFRYRGPKAVRALGFGVGDLFKDSRFDAGPAGPLLSIDELETMNPEGAWNALN